MNRPMKRLISLNEWRSLSGDRAAMEKTGTVGSLRAWRMVIWGRLRRHLDRQRLEMQELVNGALASEDFL